MKKTLRTKAIMAGVAGFALAALTARGNTTTPDFVAAGSALSDSTYLATSAGDQLQPVDFSAITNSNPANVADNNLRRISPGPDPTTIQPVQPALDSVPDAGSTVALLGLALLAVEAVSRKLRAT